MNLSTAIAYIWMSLSNFYVHPHSQLLMTLQTFFLIRWVQRDSYLPMGSQSLKAAAKAKLR